MLDALMVGVCIFLVVGLVGLAAAVLAAVVALAALAPDCEEQERP